LIKYTEASLFDLDQTLLTENSSYAFGTYLYKKKAISLPSMLYCVGCYGLHKVGQLSLHDVHKKIFKSLFLNRSQDYFTELDTIDKMICSPAIQRLQDAQRQGHFTAILSSSPSFLVKLLAEHFGVCECLATEYKLDKEGRFISIEKVLDGEGKAQFLQNLSKRKTIPLEKIAAYTDSFLDLPLLMQVGKAVGVNPDNKLHAICVKKGWEII
jgi:HAD superfamily hydrolase (TIGR01490 family)